MCMERVFLLNVMLSIGGSQVLGGRRRRPLIHITEVGDMYGRSTVFTQRRMNLML